MSFIIGKKQKQRLIESYGSFKGQFEMVRETAERMLSNMDLSKNGEYYFKREFKEFGYVHFKVTYKVSTALDVNVYGASEGSNGEYFLSLSIFYDQRLHNKYKGNLTFTLAHEILHNLQRLQKKPIKGSNGKSGNIYQNVLKFRDGTQSELVQTFFNAIYYCNPMEISANASAVSNYLDVDPPKTFDYRECLKILPKIDAYQRYNEFLETFKYADSNSFSTEDKNYIKSCLTSNGIYSPDNFNTDSYINKTIKMIRRNSQYAINKMERNIMNYLDVDNR